MRLYVLDDKGFEKTFGSQWASQPLLNQFHSLLSLRLHGICSGLECERISSRYRGFIEVYAGFAEKSVPSGLALGLAKSRLKLAQKARYFGAVVHQFLSVIYGSFAALDKTERR